MNEVTYIRPDLYDKQIEAFFGDNRYSFIEGSTKSGKTVAGISWILEEACLYGGLNKHWWWVAPVYAQAKIAYSRTKHSILPEFRKCNEADLTITLPNGSIIEYKSGEKPDNLYGEDVFGALMDEASRSREESFHAVRSTLTATRGKLRCIGNVRGRKNWFFKMCRRAQAGAKGMLYEKITSIDAIRAGVLDIDEVRDAKALLPAHVFKELYLCIPTDDGGNPFGIADIKKCIIKEFSKKPTVRYGLDLAKSVDWVVLIGLDEDNHMTCCHRWQAPWRDTIRRVVALVGNIKTLVDSTGVGDPVLEELQNLSPGVFEGYKFTQGSKQQLMENLAMLIQRQKIGIADETCIDELESFEYEYSRNSVKYTAPEGMHDDCVMALSLAALGATIKPGGENRILRIRSL